MPENSKKMTNLRHPSPRAVVLAYDGLCTFEFGVAVEIFGLPRPELGDEWYRFAVAGIDSGELRATGGIRIITDGDLSLLESADLIVVPGWRGLDSPVPDTLCEALRQASVPVPASSALPITTIRRLIRLPNLGPKPNVPSRKNYSADRPSTSIPMW